MTTVSDDGRRAGDTNVVWGLHSGRPAQGTEGLPRNNSRKNTQNCPHSGGCCGVVWCGCCGVVWLLCCGVVWLLWCGVVVVLWCGFCLILVLCWWLHSKLVVVFVSADVMSVKGGGSCDTQQQQQQPHHSIWTRTKPWEAS